VLSDIASRQLRGAVLLAVMMSFVQSMLGVWTEAAVVGLVAFGLYYASFAAHEAGHYVVAKFLGASPVMTIVGVESRPSSRVKVLWISVAGPVVGVAVPLVFLGVTPHWRLVGLGLTAAVLALNHGAMLLPWFPDGRIIKQSIREQT